MMTVHQLRHALFDCLFAKCTGSVLVMVVAMMFAPVALPTNPKPVSVTVRTLQSVQVFPSRSAPATVVSLNDTQISAEVSGIIEEIPVKPGDRVDSGALLGRLGCRDHELEAREPEAQLKQAEAERVLAESEYKRAAKLREKGAISQVEFQRRKTAAVKSAAEVHRLRSAVEQSQRTISKCEVRAPFSAVVVRRFASVGELASAGMKLLRIVDEDDLEVSGQIQQNDLSSLQNADDLKFLSRSQTYSVALRSVVPVFDQKVDSYEVRFKFGSRKPAPGQTGRIVWRAAKPHIPPDLLISRDGQLGVFLVQDSRARFRPLEGSRVGQAAATELPAAARIIVDGRYSLRDGQPVTVVAPN